MHRCMLARVVKSPEPGDPSPLSMKMDGLQSSVLVKFLVIIVAIRFSGLGELLQGLLNVMMIGKKPCVDDFGAGCDWAPEAIASGGSGGDIERRRRT